MIKRTKTWKLGEICRGGIITAIVEGTRVTIIGKDWKMSAGTKRGSNQSNAKEWTRLELPIYSPNRYEKASNFLNDLTSSYYSNVIIEWINNNLPVEHKIG